MQELKKNSDYIGKTKELAHHKITIPLPWNPKARWTVSYYIAKLPSGETFIHENINRTNGQMGDGYGGRTIDFLMEDGTIEPVVGPYYISYPHTKKFEWFEKFGTEKQKEALKHFMEQEGK